jgi:hypothetical protein
MRTVPRLLAIAATAVIATPGVLLATGGEAFAWETRCTYYVDFSGAPVRENPDTNSVIRTTKAYGSLVSSKHSCGYTVHDPESNTNWISVNTTAATDNEGWMRVAHLCCASG